MLPSCWVRRRGQTDAAGTRVLCSQPLCAPSAGMMAATHSSLTDGVSLQVGPDEKLLQDPPPAPPTWNVEAFVDAVKVKVHSTEAPYPGTAVT